MSMTSYLAGLAAAAGSPAAARAAARCAKVCGAAWAPVPRESRNRHSSQPTNYYNTNQAWGSRALTLVTSCDFYLLDQNMARVSKRIALVALRSGSSFSRATARRHTWHSMAHVFSVPRDATSRLGQRCLQLISFRVAT